MSGDAMLAWSVVLATFLGPILAVFVTRWVDDRRLKQSRKLETFRVLIRTRRTQLSYDFVAALNMVEIDFFNAPKVLTTHAELMRHLGAKTDDSWLDRTQRLVARLLYAMGQDVGYTMEQLDILEGGYIPQAMVDDETEQQRLRRSLLALLSGAHPLPVTIQQPGQNQAAKAQQASVMLHDVPPPG
ncbi:hypothetical protein G6M23_21190 [Agrobacterium tumefaciens]|uniref:DUF6680 family protein n=2 Tax=Agrobacterium tumefaciens TaxID=358 RepID=UPI0013AF5D6E|nr:DUF6680 family protein [Agrobacterium tumefaciens]NTD93849.1 hypothetical protein [Agrobacterium tumefaciens]NTE03957.1 hypothetical protein [Agrobacterium tumefaciens]NTE24653.1 hypothetical protein [Agrobacterium tumefaciens]NTE41401.1 hypothetical protein [Agrobacterium tumefaciens]NTF00628.1 hypothetical protein [Agrobacterium tumefaciens]